MSRLGFTDFIVTIGVPNTVIDNLVDLLGQAGYDNPTREHAEKLMQDAIEGAWCNLEGHAWGFWFIPEYKLVEYYHDDDDELAKEENFRPVKIWSRA